MDRVYTVIVQAKYVSMDIHRHKIIEDTRDWLIKNYDLTDENDVVERYSLDDNIKSRYIIFGRGVGANKHKYVTGQRCITLRIRYNSDNKARFKLYNPKPYLEYFESLYF